MAGKLQVELTVIDQATKELNGIAREFNSFQGKVAAVGAAVSKIFVGGAITGAIFEGIKHTIAAGIEYGDMITDMAHRTGMAVESVQQLDYVAKQSGTSIDALQRPIKSLSENAFNNAKAFGVLGISVKDQNGNLKESGQLFNETILRLSEVKNSTERSAIVGKLFGKQSTEVNAILSQGKERIKELISETGRYNLVLGKDTIKQLHDAKEATELADREWKVASADLTVTFTPAIIALAQKAGEAARAIRDMYGSVDRKKISTDLAEDKIRALQEEESGLKKNIELAGKNKDAEVVWMGYTGEMRHARLRVAQAELIALQAQLNMNEKIVKSNEPENAASTFTGSDFKPDKKTKTKADNPLTPAQIYAENLSKVMAAAHKKRMSDSKENDDDLAKQDAEAKKSQLHADEVYYHQTVEMAQEAIREKKAEQDMAVSLAEQSVNTMETVAQASKANGVMQQRIRQAGAMIDGGAAVMGAWRSAMQLAYPANIIAGVAMSALLTAQTMAQVSIIEQQKFAHGGIVGGSSFSGDNINARVNSGEMILNNRQQSNLFRQISGGTTNNSGHTFNISLHDNSGNLVDSMTTQIRSGTANVDRLVGLLMQRAGVK